MPSCNRARDTPISPTVGGRARRATRKPGCAGRGPAATVSPVEEQRRVRAIVSVDDRVLGVVPPFPVDSPFWADVEPVVRHLDAMLGVPTAVLRIVRIEGGTPPSGGEVTYLVEAERTPLRPVAWEPAALPDDHPLRAAWARPGGPRAIVDWARSHVDLIGPPLQVKTWNLSCVHQLPTTRGPVWSKAVGGFQTSESVVVNAVAAADPTLVPAVLAADPARGWTLLDHIPGDDLWDADEPTIRATVTRWVTAQATLAATAAPAEAGPVVAGPAGAGPAGAVPDRRLGTLGARAAGIAARVADQLTDAENAGLAALLADLPGRIAAIEAAGLPDTLVHGDFHPGNWRAAGGGPARIVDWADSFVGHPAADLLRLRGYLPDERKPVADRAWIDAWRAAVPGSDPAAVIPLFAPLVHLYGAWLYQRFLDHIEPDEHPYHRDDPAAELRAALATA